MPEFISVLRWIRDTAYPYMISAVSSVSSDKAAVDAVAGTLSSITSVSNQAIDAALEAEASAESAASSLSQTNAKVTQAQDLVEEINGIVEQAENSALQSAASAQEAQDLVDEINGISAQVQTLMPGSLATASYNPADGKLTFGIPQGSKGDRGDNFTPNTQGALANRVTYDGQNGGFSYLATDTGDLYFKLSNTSGNWSTGFPFGKGEEGEPGEAGVGISSIAKTSGTGAAGTTDVYTITLSDTTTYNFNVYNGANGQVQSVAGRTGAIVLTKADVGLNNVDNTSDLDKPVSTATQNAKQNTLISGTNIKSFNGISLLGSGEFPTALSSGSPTQDPNLTDKEYIVSNNLNCPSAKYYWHIRTQFYLAQNIASNRAQIAIQYSGGASAYVRNYIGGVWSSWVRLDNELSQIGVGQTWQDVIGSRKIGVTYTNTTGKPISVAVDVSLVGVGSLRARIDIDGISLQNTYDSSSTSITRVMQITAIVPDGSTYIVKNLESATIFSWKELRD